MAKEGKRERYRASKEPLPISDLDAFLFDDGKTVADYCVSGGIISFKNEEGRWFDLHINHERLATALCERLKALGVKQEAAP